MRYVIVLALVVAVVGCRHYQVTDAEGNAHYTKKAKTDEQGVVHFKDAKTGENMMLASASVQKISYKQYRHSTRAAEEMPAGHWKIVDLTRLRIYYSARPPTSTEWTTEFQDAVTGENVRLTSANVTTITADEFQRSLAFDREAARVQRTTSWD
ncbi:MAG: hypothetical protein O7C98_13705 [Planctomycetota bacterium]|nr:hypothetical protein [Planctomycetota bacterium]